jgi:predicted Zn-dependent protease
MSPRLPSALLLLALGACAGVRAPRDLSDAELSSAAPRQVAAAGWGRLLRNDAARAGKLFAEAARRDGADPWARLGLGWLARRALDDEEEVRQLVALVQGAPGHPLAGVAARRLGELAEAAPALAESIEAGLEQAAAAGHLSGLVAWRVRAARAEAAEALGEGERAARLRAENGAVTAWTLLGPCSAYHLLELDRPFAPELGPLPERVDGPPGSPPASARTLLIGDGLVGLEAEPPGRGDVFYLAADLTAEVGGDYLVLVGGTGSLVAWLDGEPLAERRTAAGFPPSAQVVPRRLAPGRHRLLVKAVRGAGPGPRLAVSAARADGAPSDLRAAPAAPGAPAAAIRRGAPPAPVNLAPGLAGRLAREVGPAAARLVAARDALETDREAAKALLDEALALAPGSAALLSARAEATASDPSLDPRAARGSAEALLDRALAADPGDSAARLQRADWMRGGGRLDDAGALLAALPPADARRPRALLARARLELDRGFAEGAERDAEEALRGSGLCAAAALLYPIADGRDAAARADELVRHLSRCPGGRERLADHLRRRGDAAGAVRVREALARATPARPDRRMELARALAAAGDPGSGARELGELAATWPRDPRIPRMRAELLELAGDAAGARAARERALALDGADLPLRRALALEDGKEPLADLAEDGPGALAAWRAAAPRADSSGVYALDHAAVEAYGDGSYTERVHQVVAVLDQRAVDRFGEVQVPAGAELLLARTLKRDGRVLEPEERGEKGTLSLPGLEPGDAAEWAWLRGVPSRGPALPGFAADAFFFRSDLPMWRTAYAVAAPRGAGLAVDARRIDPPPVAREGEREVVRAARERVAALLPEPSAPPESEYMPMVQVGAGAGPEALAPALADALAEVARPSLELVRLAREIEASVPRAERGGERLLRAAYARVAQRVQGQGGGIFEPAGRVLSRGRGGRLVVLQSVLGVLGVKARLALARDFARDPQPARFPRSDQYSAPLLRVEHGGRVYWLDAGAPQVPFGALPGALRGAEAIVLPAPGEAPLQAHVPGDDGADRRELVLRVELDREGAATVEGTERYQGYDAAAYKSSLEHVDAQQRRQAIEQTLARGFRSARLESLAFEGEADPGAPLVVRWRLRVPEWARAEEGRLVIEAPVQPPRLTARYARLPTRETPLLVASPESVAMRVEVKPPPGYRPAPHPAASIEGPFGSYRRVERVEGGKLLREDHYRLERGRIAPGDYPRFASFAASVDEAQAAPMAFPGASPGVAGNPRDASPKWARSLEPEGAAPGHAP